MRIKDIIEVLCHYNIERVTFPNNKVGDTEDEMTVGYCSHEKGIIYIDKDISMQRMREIIIHELVHAHLHMKGINDVDDDGVDTDVVWERANALYKRLYKDKSQ